MGKDGQKVGKLNQTFPYPIASGWDQTTTSILSKWHTVTEAIKLLWNIPAYQGFRRYEVCSFRFK